MTGHRLSIAGPVGPAAHQFPPSDLRIQRSDLSTTICAGSVPSGRFGIWQAVPGKFHLCCPHNQPLDPVTDGQDLVRVNLIPLGWPHRSAWALLYVSHPASAIASVFRGRLCAPSECRRGATHIGSTHSLRIPASPDRSFRKLFCILASCSGPHSRKICYRFLSSI